MEDEDFERSTLEEGLHTSLHFATGKICSQLEQEFNVKFSKEFIATVSDLAFRQAGIFAEDIEMFARHAKRATINTDDVKLLVRRSKSLYEHISKMTTDLAATCVKTKAKKRKLEGESSSTIDT